VKALKPVRKHKLVDEMRGDWGVSIRRACRVFLVDTSTYHHRFVAETNLDPKPFTWTDRTRSSPLSDEGTKC